LIVTHTWERRPIALRFRDNAGDRPDLQPRSKPEFDQPEPADVIRLADGREFRGRVVREDENEIVFEVVIGRARGEMSFSRDEVVEVVRSAGESVENDVDG
jgi:hypothetical protein